jgi:hypothetical protein
VVYDGERNGWRGVYLALFLVFESRFADLDSQADLLEGLPGLLQELQGEADLEMQLSQNSVIFLRPQKHHRHILGP